jgi:hypothetical protein
MQKALSYTVDVGPQAYEFEPLQALTLKLRLA